MKKYLKIILLSISVLVLRPFSAFSFEGPLQYKNQFPLFMPLNTPYMESAAPESSLSANLSYSSTFLLKNSANADVGLDMETAALDLRAKKEFSGSLELGAEVPFISFNAGVMDGFLERYHRTFGFADYGRAARSKNKFLYDVNMNGAAIVRGESGTGLGDIRLTAKKTIMAGDPAISVMGSVELPTGDAKKGYGNGNFDTGATLLVDKVITRWLKSYLNLGMVFPGDLAGYQTVKLRDYTFFGAALEADATRRLSIIGQIYHESDPYPKAGIGSIDRSAVLFIGGARYSSGQDFYEFSFTEDPSTSGAPDVSFNFTYKKKF